VPNFHHIPVLAKEVLAALNPVPGGFYVDGTVGGGGHAWEILKASGPTGRLFGCDRDGVALEAAQARLAEFAGRFELKRANFADLGGLLEPGSADGLLLDCGLSSPQLDEAGRGFSFQQDGPLDARMDTRQSLTAAQLVNELPVEELARIFWESGGEPQSRRFARAIAKDREQRPFAGTLELAGLIERLAPRRGKRTHPATRVFQALRVVVNDETGSLERGLAAAVKILKPGGRLAVISFQPMEDRVIKAAGREFCRDYDFDGPVDDPALRHPRAPVMKWVQRKAIKPGEDEVVMNPRSRSAQLRILEKI
jgi:16S rRNA (cytosine1402-N4)-methyltransferase